jgi:hypothetical protein
VLLNILRPLEPKMPPWRVPESNGSATAPAAAEAPIEAVSRFQLSICGGEAGILELRRLG